MLESRQRGCVRECDPSQLVENPRTEEEGCHPGHCLTNLAGDDAVHRSRDPRERMHWSHQFQPVATHCQVDDQQEMERGR